MIHRAKDRGYCLEMICADFLAGASIDGGNAEQNAQIELKTTGTLSPTAYAAVLAEIRRIQACGPQSEEGIILAEPKIDDQFLLLLERCRKLLEMGLEEGRRMLEKEFEDSRPTYALPSDSVVSDILRYETAAEKEFDWALQKLLESQQRRRKAQAPASIQVSSDQ